MLSLRSPLSCCTRVADQIDPAAQRSIPSPVFSIETRDPELDMLGRQQIPLHPHKNRLLALCGAPFNMVLNCGSKTS